MYLFVKSLSKKNVFTVSKFTFAMFSIESCEQCGQQVLTFDNVFGVPLFLVIWYLMNTDPGDEIIEQHECSKTVTFDKEKLHKMNVQLFLMNYLYIYYSENQIPLKEINSFITKKHSTNHRECCTVS